ncbi:MAG: chorismate mutase [Oscillospiraceae bacterium]|jgi:chorismate mutase/prephenate dehydratase|nr:chorismate mutase [Oscillospiraceae bacterium]
MSLDKQREEINRIDKELAALFERRMEVSAAVAREKELSGLSITDTARENAVLERVQSAVKAELAPYARQIYTYIMSLSKDYQAELLKSDSEIRSRLAPAFASPPDFDAEHAVAVQGVEGAFSHLCAARTMKSPNLLFFDSFSAVFSAVENGLCRYGLVPCENSIFGSISEVYSLLAARNAYIARSVKLKVSQCLLTAPGTKLGDIKTVISHPQALGQCADFIKKLKLRESERGNTAFAAREVSELGDKSVAAIGSELCGEIYGLTVLKSDIQNEKSNYTRFLCLSREMQIPQAPDRVTVLLSLPHENGSLAACLDKIAAFGFNVSKIESMPEPGTDFQYRFVLTIDASAREDATIRMLSQIAENATRFRILGGYAECVSD